MLPAGVITQANMRIQTETLVSVPKMLGISL